MFMVIWGFNCLVIQIGISCHEEESPRIFKTIKLGTALIDVYDLYVISHYNISERILGECGENLHNANFTLLK